MNEGETLQGILRAIRLLRRRWPFGAAMIAAAAAIATGLFLFLGPSGGSPASADKVLADAVDAEQHPENVGLRSYDGEIEISVNGTAFTPAAPTDAVNSNDDPSIVQADIPSEPTPVAREGARIWYQAPNKYRFEVTSTVDGQKPETRSTIIDNGQTTWEYEAASNKYASAPSQGATSIQDARFLFAPGAFINDIGDLLTSLKKEQATHAVLAGSAKVLGRDAYVVEITEAATASGATSDITPQKVSGGVVRLWLDKQYLVLLRLQVDSQTGGSYGIQLSKIEFNAGVDDKLFQFSPSPDALEVDQQHLLAASGGTNGGTGSSGNLGQHVDVPSDALAPTTLIAGYQARSVYSSYNSAGTYKVQFLIRQDGGKGYISAQERRDVGDLPDALKKGDVTTIHGHQAWLQKKDNLLHLAWQEGDLVIYIISRGVTPNQLSLVAESMRPGTQAIRTPNPQPPAQKETPQP